MLPPRLLHRDLSQAFPRVKAWLANPFQGDPFIEQDACTWPYTQQSPDCTLLSKGA